MYLDGNCAKSERYPKGCKVDTLSITEVSYVLFFFSYCIRAKKKKTFFLNEQIIFDRKNVAVEEVAPFPFRIIILGNCLAAKVI